MKLKLIYVKWADATAPEVSWFTKEQLLDWAEKDNYSVESVGWLFKETKTFICLFAEIGHTFSVGQDVPSYGRMIKIPKGWIMQRKYLKC